MNLQIYICIYIWNFRYLDKFTRALIHINKLGSTLTCTLWKTFPSRDSNVEAFTRGIRCFSRLIKTSDKAAPGGTLLLLLLVVTMWITTSSSPSLLADTTWFWCNNFEDLLFVCWWWASCLELTLDKSSSFCWINFSTSCWSSGIYFNTRDTVAGMLSFFCQINPTHSCYV